MWDWFSFVVGVSVLGAFWILWNEHKLPTRKCRICGFEHKCREVKK